MDDDRHLFRIVIQPVFHFRGHLNLAEAVGSVQIGDGTNVARQQRLTVATVREQPSRRLQGHSLPDQRLWEILVSVDTYIEELMS